MTDNKNIIEEKTQIRIPLSLELIKEIFNLDQEAEYITTSSSQETEK